MKQVKVGVIGVGHLGQHHARIYSLLKNARLVGVADIRRKKVQEIAQKCQCEPFRDYRKLLKKIEAVSIAAPTTLHYKLAREVLRAGKDVLIEKPITSEVWQAQELLELAKERGCIVQVGHIERFNPAIISFQKILTEPKFIEVHRLCKYNPRGTDVSVVLDLMIHDIDIILNMVRSKISSTDAVGVGVIHKTADIANARIRFENGCVANVTTSRVSPSNMRKIRVFQPNTYISLDYEKQQGVLYQKKLFRIAKRVIPFEKAEPLRLELESFIDCIIHRLDPVVSGEHGKQALEVAVKIAEQIEKGQYGE
ncbi:MAG: Gfo/Idh/MocA family oxidoreductase [Candidatus Aureabacteria bacterium]|nr:Gfo/Idh/MocA family oxidoreductase [Candidatus Auribacterota bacterium]